MPGRRRPSDERVRSAKDSIDKQAEYIPEGSTGKPTGPRTKAGRELQDYVRRQEFEHRAGQIEQMSEKELEDLL